MATETSLERYEKYTGLALEALDNGVVRLAFAPGRAREQHAHMSEIWPELDRDPQVRVVLLGPGRDSKPGSDISTYAEDTLSVMWRMATEWDLLAQLIHEAGEMVHNMINFTKPVVAMYPGTFQPTVIHSDISIATRDCTFFDWHTKYGGVAGDHVVMSWPLHMSMAKVKYHALTGEPMNGEEAERLGLISLVVDDVKELETRGEEVAQRLARGSQRALSWTKKALNYHYKQNAAAFDLGLALEQLSFLGPDAKAGIVGMQEDREPDFPEYVLSDRAASVIVPRVGDSRG